MEKKTRIEKVTHEIIRDLPEAMKASERFDKGLITFDAALEIILNEYRREKNKCLQV